MRQAFSVSRSSGNLVNAQQAKYVVGVLTLLVDVVGHHGILGTILRQAISEVESLMTDPVALGDDRVTI